MNIRLLRTVFVAGMILFTRAASAQTTADPDLSVLPLASPSELLGGGNFWYLTRTNEPPAPGFTLPFLGLYAPVYRLEPRHYLVDDRGLDPSVLRKAVSAFAINGGSSQTLLDSTDILALIYSEFCNGKPWFSSSIVGFARVGPPPNSAQWLAR